jgi:alginate O-acetyltransferase complex protein AlgI
MESQLSAMPAARFEDISTGFLRFMMGVAKKTLIADTLGVGVDQIFAADPAGIGFGYAWAGVLFFAFQIYFDFSGYSDMAIGIARMLGFRLRENFDMPYISCSVTEFWRRWHISLTTWIREYLYIPLGGNRVSQTRLYFNLWICFLASGLWHGAAWTYVVWGAYNGLFLVLEAVSCPGAGPHAAGRGQSYHLHDHNDRLDLLSCPLIRSGDRLSAGDGAAGFVQPCRGPVDRS